MKKYTFLMILAVATFFCLGAQSDCDKAKTVKNSQVNSQKNKNMTNEKMPDDPLSAPTNSDIKTLAESSNARMSEPFVFVARTKETYAQLQTMAENLPSASEIDFSKMAVVAAFAGEKNTGGYSVSIEGSIGKVSVKVETPAADAIVTEALTMPYKVVQVPVGEEQSLEINLSENWMSSAQTYKITGGEFEYSGGFIGKEVKFEPTGTIKVLRSGDYATLIFNVREDLEASQRKLIDVTSGTLKNDKGDFARLEAMNFIENPHPPLVVSGTISGDKLSLEFKPGKRNYIVNDGFVGSGKLEAVKQ